MPCLEKFAGAWRVEREIEDAITGQTTRFDGTAVFTPDNQGMVYDEEGIMSLNGQQTLQASRRYLWRKTHGGVEVLFSDGRPFHFIGSGTTPQATHVCTPDLYQVCYEFGHWPDWRATWRVAGPRKDYVMHSHYIRVAGARPNDLATLDHLGQTAPHSEHVADTPNR